jgi:protein-disulfide isomerase
MTKSENIAFCFVSLLSCAFLLGTAIVHQERAVARYLAAGSVVHVDPAIVVGRIGEGANAGGATKYTLVEFGDYECPACRAANAEIEPLLTRYKSRVRFLFRNYPLADLHPFAMRAALTAETAREKGRFWRVHDALYSEDVICGASIDRIGISNGLNMAEESHGGMTTAMLAVRSDQKAGQLLGVFGTPTFFLCGPAGRVTRLRSLEDIGTYVQ